MHYLSHLLYLSEQFRLNVHHFVLQVFGERPPVQTLMILESDLYERLTIAEEERPESAKEPALMLLWEFLPVSDAVLVRYRGCLFLGIVSSAELFVAAFLCRDIIKHGGELCRLV